MPSGGLNFGAATNMDCLIDQPYQFDFYDGGGLDIAFLGLARGGPGGQRQRQQIRSAPRRAPAASSTSARTPKKIVFVGTFTAGGSKVSVEDGKLEHRPGRRGRKFVKQVEQVTFSGRRLPRMLNQPVIYITERCVFTLTAKGLELMEIAPGIDLQRDILARWISSRSSEETDPDGRENLSCPDRWDSRRIC